MRGNKVDIFMRHHLIQYHWKNYVIPFEREYVISNTWLYSTAILEKYIRFIHLIIFTSSIWQTWKILKITWNMRIVYNKIISRLYILRGFVSAIVIIFTINLMKWFGSLLVNCLPIVYMTSSCNSSNWRPVIYSCLQAAW